MKSFKEVCVKNYVHLIIIFLLVIIIAMLLIYGSKVEYEHFVADGRTCDIGDKLLNHGCNVGSTCGYFEKTYKCRQTCNACQKQVADRCADIRKKYQLHWIPFEGKCRKPCGDGVPTPGTADGCT